MKVANLPVGAETGEIVILVDLTPLRAGGKNGGIKPTIFNLLAGLAGSGYPFTFVYLTSASSHSEVRAVARGNDMVVCVLEDEPWAKVRDSAFKREYFLPQPPADLPRHFGVDLCYAPFGALLYFSPGVPVLALICDLLHEDWPYGLIETEREERRKYIEFTCRNSALIQCISRSGVHNMLARYEIAPEKLFYTYLPPVLPDGAPGADTGARPYFFYPANFWPHKNHDLLLIAFNIYRHRQSDQSWDLVLTGHPDENMERLRDLADLFGLNEKVLFLGYVQEKEMEVLYREAGALVFPSLHEGFGIPLLEAWHYGKPVISADVFSLPEVGGEACLFVNPRDPMALADALSTLSGDPGLADLLVRKGKDRLSLFDLDNEIEHLAQRILSLVSPPWKRNRRELVPLLELPTPMDEELWSFHFKPGKRSSGGRFTLRLGDCPLGSHRFEEGGELCLSFRPAGRRLGIFVDEKARLTGDDLFAEIGVSRGENIYLKLFETRP